MGVRDSVFGSKGERSLFRSLRAQWGNRFAIYPSLPFCQIIETRDLSVTEDEQQFLFKSSVDYTLCEEDGRPVLSIEFDGLAGGFSRRGRYVPTPGSRHLNRARKLDLKLRVADEVGYPLIVVSFDEKRPLGRGTELTIVDGIVGQVLARREFHSEVVQRFEEARPALAGMNPDEEHEFVQDLVLDVEAECEMKWDPLDQAATEALGDLLRHGLSGGYSMEFLDEPGTPLYPIEDRIHALRHAARVGRRVTIQTPRREIREEAWVRNIDGAFFSPLTIAQNTALWLAARRAVALMTGPGRTSHEKESHARQS
jgi:hypothetical protein